MACAHLLCWGADLPIHCVLSLVVYGLETNGPYTLMAQYSITYFNGEAFTTETLEAPSKALFIRAMRDRLCPTKKLKEFTAGVEVTKVKVVKKQVMPCAICRGRVERKDFVGHVRAHQ